MRIIHVIPILGCGGAEILVTTMIEKLFHQGHEVELVCLQPHHETYKNLPNKEFLEKHIPIHIISDKISFKFGRYVDIKNSDFEYIIEKFKPKIIHAHLYLAMLNCLALKRRDEIELVIHFHDNMAQLKKLKLTDLFSKKRLADLYEKRWVLKRTKLWNPKVIAISRDTIKYIQNNYFSPKAYLLKNAIDLDKFKIDLTIDKSIQLVSVGNLVKKKGHDLAIKTIYILKNWFPNITLEILGYGAEFDNLSKMIETLNLKSNVKLMGNVGDIEKHLNKSLIYLHTASYEPFGLVLIEAMACGLPIVCTDGRGNRDLILEGHNGFLIESRDPEVLAHKIAYLLENRDVCEKMGVAARTFAMGFDIEVYVKRLIEIYDEK